MFQAGSVSPHARLGAPFKAAPGARRNGRSFQVDAVGTVNGEVGKVYLVEIKSRLRDLKSKREAALEAGNKLELHRRRRQIHRLKRKLRKAAKLTH